MQNEVQHEMQNEMSKMATDTQTPTEMNGTEISSDVMTLRLSDAFTVSDEAPSLELTVTLLNINPGHNQQLLDSCKTLRDYSEYDEEKHMRQEREYHYEKGLKAGRMEGRLEGKMEVLLQQIHKKQEKGKSIEEIASELEESVETIQQLLTEEIKESSED